MVMDGIQLEKDNSVLYVIQDALALKVLYAGYLYESISALGVSDDSRYHLMQDT